jgi:hypothetical protein
MPRHQGVAESGAIVDSAAANETHSSAQVMADDKFREIYGEEKGRWSELSDRLK